jgi:transposase
MARVAVALTCTAEQRAELMAFARSRTEEARLVERAKIVLACLEGQRNDAVGREFGVRANTVGLWRKRFAAAGLAGLRDRARPGKTPKYGSDLRLRVLRQLELPPPKGLASWDGASLAAALGASDDAVWRLLRRGGQLRRRRSWCVSTDPQFATKAADIIGLYLNPPANALVLSVDEKPTIQALERASGYVLTSSGKIVHGLKSTYKRHGTVNLFAALEVATGVIRGKTTQTKKRVDFQAFMTDLVAEQPPDREIHVILDNLSTHKNNDHWLAAHPNVTFRFAPTSCKLAQPGGNLVRHLQPKGPGRSQLCQHRATGPGNPRLHRSLQPERSTLRLAQARG